MVPNRQARADGQLVSIDETSLYHEARAAAVIYKETLHRELHQSLGFERRRSTRRPGWLSWPGLIATPLPPRRDLNVRYRLRPPAAAATQASWE
jgi:hypothetical protein